MKEIRSEATSVMTQKEVEEVDRETQEEITEMPRCNRDSLEKEMTKE